MSLQIDSFDQRDIEPATTLLADRQRRARQTHPLLPAAFEGATAWQESLTEASARPGGVACREGGSLVGFMLGREELTPQDSMGARWGDARAGFIPVDGHAVATDADALAVYMAMYTSVSEAWVRGGFFLHGVHVLAADLAAHDAFVAMGFGRKVVAAVRDLDPISPPSGAVIVREATTDDTKAIHRLELELDNYHSRAPIFLPMDPATDAAASRFMDDVIANPKAAIFLAEQDGKPVGMNSLLPESFIPKCVQGEGQVYLYQGIVSEDARSGGIGEALLARSIRWARDQGYSQMALHYFSANPVGGAFWRKHGFVAAQHAMSRHVDERIAWARDWR